MRNIFRTAVSLLVVVGCFSYVSSAQVAGGVRGQIPGDECESAIQAYLGATYFDSSNASPSFNGDPDESQCAGTYLDWNNSPDIWFGNCESSCSCIEATERTYANKIIIVRNERVLDK